MYEHIKLLRSTTFYLQFLWPYNILREFKRMAWFAQHRCFRSKDLYAFLITNHRLYDAQSQSHGRHLMICVHFFTQLSCLPNRYFNFILMFFSYFFSYTFSHPLNPAFVTHQPRAAGGRGMLNGCYTIFERG